MTIKVALKTQSLRGFNTSGRILSRAQKPINADEA